MSVESTLHPAKATKRQLIQFLEGRGFKPCEHLWKWPRGTVHYAWFGSEEFLSFDGVEATIFKPDEDPQKLGDCKWALHTRTRSSGSPADKRFQNQTIRQARELFGGNFYNDWGGRNRHSVEPVEYRDAPSRGLYLSFERAGQHLSMVQFAIPKPLKGMEKKDSPLGFMDPNRTLYNALVPFPLAVVEAFLMEAFVILFTYNSTATEKLASQNRRVDIGDVVALAEGGRTLAELVASWYSFQNLKSIQKAFDDYFSIDFRHVLRSSKAGARGEKTLDVLFSELVEERHKVVHGARLDYDLTEDRIKAYFDDALAVISSFVEFLERDRGMIIRDETVIGLHGDDDA